MAISTLQRNIMNQSVNKSENVLQVSGDVAITHNYGLSVNELKSLVDIFMKENLPKLREEAAKEAAKNVSIFLQDFEKNIYEKLKSIDTEKFKDPDVQSSINDAVIEVAKKGEKIETELLTSLVIERLSGATTDYVSLVASEAIKVIGKLTPEQISFLTLAVVLMNTKTQINTLAQLAPLANDTISLISEAPLSISQKSHLEYAGCLKVNNFLTNSALQVWKGTYEFLTPKSDEEIRQEISSVPVLQKLSDLFDVNQLGQISLTSVGQLIGLVNLSRKVKGLNYSNWLN